MRLVRGLTPNYLIISELAILIALAWGAIGVSSAQSPRDGGCTEWRDCRQLALAAADRGEYEAFHDLAWRAIQTGPPKDPALMLLLARAQALSGRPHDALVMLERLAEMGVASYATTSEDFGRVRQLPGWPDVRARIERIDRPADVPPAAAGAASSPPSAAASKPRSAAVSSLPSAAVSGPPPSAPVSSAPSAAASAASGTPSAAASAAPRPSAPAPVASPSSSTALRPSAPASTARLSALALAPAADALRFSTGRLAVGGLAYDAVSQRFVIGDRLGRKVIVVGEGSTQAVDLVGPASAGFHEISAMGIDAKRGDLWVASAAAAGGAGALHRLQLVSGRPLRSFPFATDREPVERIDLAIGAAGSVFVLDSVNRQVLELRAGSTSLERLVQIDAQEPVSLTVGDDEGIAYVAHRDGVSRIDLRARTATLVTAPNEVSLARLERIRWHRRALIAVAVDEDGSRRISRLELNASGTAVTRVTTLETSVPIDGQTFVTVSGDELVYLVAGSGNAAGRSSADSPGPSEFVAYRVGLR